MTDWSEVKRIPLGVDLTHINGFLHERQIAHRIYEESGEQIIAVADPRLVPSVAQFIEEVLQGKLIIEQHENVNDEVQTDQSPSLALQIITAPITAMLILLSAVGGLLAYFDSEIQWAHWFTFTELGAQEPVNFLSALSTGEAWRLITPAFLHFGFLHFLFNSLWMWDLGRRLEFYAGKKNYLLFFIVAAIFSNTAQYIWSHDSNFGGMSGVVYALVGFMMISQRLSPHRLTAVPASVIGFMLFWLVFCMTGTIDAFVGGGVANAAHLGGLVMGCVLAYLFNALSLNRKD